MALLNSDLPGLTLLSKGKVRDIYATSSPDHLLFVASDRISAYDVILKNVRTHMPFISPPEGDAFLSNCMVSATRWSPALRPSAI